MLKGNNTINIGQGSEYNQQAKLILFCTILFSHFSSQTLFSFLYLRVTDPFRAAALRALDTDSGASSEQHPGTRDSSAGQFEEVQSAFYRFSPCSPAVPPSSSICCSNSVLLPAPPPLTLETKEQSGSKQAPWSYGGLAPMVWPVHCFYSELLQPDPA